MPRARVPPPKTVDEYLAQVPPESRAALERIRRLIRTAAPKAEETITYGQPTFRQGKLRLNYAAYQDHCSLYGWVRVRDEFAEELKPFESGRGTLAFTPDRPLPSTLVKNIVKSLLALETTRRST
jgi:uncharacterized protein YdhG (YjbR/CyaY superfamily)